MKLRALLFDVDGTLADTEEAHRQAFNGAFARHGYAWSWSKTEYRDLLSVTGGKERISHFLNGLRLTPQRLDECLTEVGAIHLTKTGLYVHAVSSGLVRLRPGIERLLNDARRAGIRLALVTTTTPENVHSLVTATLGEAAIGWFDVIVAGDMVPAKKPAPDAYLATLKKLQLMAADCIAFEDSSNGLQAALAADLRTVVTTTNWTVGDDFAGAWLELPGLGDPEAPLDEADKGSLRHCWLTLEDLADAIRSAA